MSGAILSPNVPLNKLQWTDFDYTPYPPPPYIPDYPPKIILSIVFPFRYYTIITAVNGDQWKNICTVSYSQVAIYASSWRETLSPD